MTATKLLGLLLVVVALVVPTSFVSAQGGSDEIIEISGEVEVAEPDIIVIAGYTIAPASTFRLPDLAVGAVVRVEGYLLPDGTLRAISLEVIADPEETMDFGFGTVVRSMVMERLNWTQTAGLEPGELLNAVRNREQTREAETVQNKGDLNQTGPVQQQQQQANGNPNPAELVQQQQQQANSDPNSAGPVQQQQQQENGQPNSVDSSGQNGEPQGQGAPPPAGSTNAPSGQQQGKGK